MTTDSPFKKGSTYTRVEIGWILLPDTGRPAGGNWDTGYVRVDDWLVIFMNIGVPGKTSHDFDNDYDPETGLIKWFGKPKSHSQQPTFKQLLNGELTPLFFARWDNKNPAFTYLGIGKIVDLKDGVQTKSGSAVQATVKVDDADLILRVPSDSPSEVPAAPSADTPLSSFALEKHLEEFLVANWALTELGQRYDILEEAGQQIGQQFRTETGPVDLLAISKDKSHYLVVELKRDRASDAVVGQTLRYMGWVARHLCGDDQSVKGVIVALQGDARLENAIYAVPNLEFIRYEIDFRLVEGFST